MWTIPVPSSSETSSHGITRWTTPSCAVRSSKGPAYSSPTSSSPMTVRTGSTPLDRTAPKRRRHAGTARLVDPPDVRDGRARVGDVAAAPVHPVADALELRCRDRGALGDDAAAAPSRRADAEGIDAAHAVEPGR